MPVDPTKQRKILVVHGVQTGKNEDVKPHKKIQELVEARLNGVPLDFKAEIYKYENINDAAMGKLNKVLDAFEQAAQTKIAYAKIDTSTFVFFIFFLFIFGH